METKLLPYEWASALFLLTLLFVLGVFGFLSREEALPIYEEPKESFENEITVQIQGAVQYPGNYIIKKNSKIKELLEKVMLRVDADLSKINLNKKITKNCAFLIPEREMITIDLICGDLKKTIQVPKGAYSFELIDQVELTQNADWSTLNTKKKLNKSQAIHIPERKLKVDLR